MDNEFAQTFEYATAKKIVEDSNLNSGDKEYYLLFIENFSDLIFYKNTDACLINIETENQIHLPEILKMYRSTLASVSYGKKVKFKFGSFIQETPRTDKLPDLWYSIGLNSFSFEGNMRKIMLESASNFSLFPIAKTDSELSSSGYYFGMNTQNTDPNIYEFNILDVFDSYNDNESIEQSVYPIYDSYPQMLAHISEIKYMDGKKEIIIKAKTS
jgi:hypothetical protein